MKLIGVDSAQTNVLLLKAHNWLVKLTAQDAVLATTLNPFDKPHRMDL